MEGPAHTERHSHASYEHSSNNSWSNYRPRQQCHYCEGNFTHYTDHYIPHCPVTIRYRERLYTDIQHHQGSTCTSTRTSSIMKTQAAKQNKELITLIGKFRSCSNFTIPGAAVKSKAPGDSQGSPNQQQQLPYQVCRHCKFMVEILLC